MTKRLIQGEEKDIGNWVEEAFRDKLDKRRKERKKS